MCLSTSSLQYDVFLLKITKNEFIINDVNFYCYSEIENVFKGHFNEIKRKKNLQD